MQKIIVPIDFSECSKNALKNAFKIAERMQMELVIYHSIVMPIGFSEANPSGAVGYNFEEMKSEAKNRLRKLVQPFSLTKKVPYKIVIRYGTLHESINELHQEEKITLVVMGSQGASGIAATLIGSNAYHVMKQVNIPIITLPENADISSMKHIALAGDYVDIPDHDDMQLLIKIVKAFYAQLHIIHIDKTNKMVKNQIDIARSLEKYLNHINHSFHFRKFDNIEEGLLSFAQEVNVNLLAMVSKQHSLFERLRHGSHTRNMMLDIPMPLMVLRE